MEPIKTTRFYSPVGEMVLGSFSGQLCICDWVQSRQRERSDRRILRNLGTSYEEGTSAVIERAAAQLDEYFEGRRTSFDIPLLFTGSDFQNSVWNELTCIPYGRTVSYAGLACRIGSPRAVRAVASANAANPISIFVPCHRVIGSNSKLTGYAGGLRAKQSLLELEQRVSGGTLSFGGGDAIG